MTSLGSDDGLSGDGLADDLRARLGKRHPVAAVATVVPGATRIAIRGAEADADFEIGSLSKSVTGLLYADALDRGEVTPDTPLGSLLPLGGGAAAGLTLASLSTHTSGLPRLAPQSEVLRRSIRLQTRGANPYGETLAELIEQTRQVRLAAPRARYSNLGFQLLGHGIAAAAGLSYADLLDQRLAQVLGLPSLYVPAEPGELRPTALPGRSGRGRPREAWTGEAVGPAGGIRSSIGDLARLVAALLDGTAPGTAALDPVRRFAGPAVRIGAGWLIVTVEGREITWHNGGTGGFCSWLGLDRAAGAGVVLVSATAGSVDRHGMAILKGLAA
jgi:CubicO group peptidase (beta-lactamase class C family)